MKRKTVLKKIAFCLIGACVALALITPALAQKSQELKDAAQMMQDGWKMFNDGQRMVIKGKEMNDLVAVQGGFEALMAPGNKVIQDGRNTMEQGAKLYAQGEAMYLKNKSTPSVAKQGLKMMSDGFKIANGDGVKMVKQGVDMNNQVAQQKGATDKFAQGNQVIKTGMETMEGGAKLFMQGESLYLKNK
jgi:uncharacterized protein with beta-barrel porin domain